MLTNALRRVGFVWNMILTDWARHVPIQLDILIAASGLFTLVLWGSPNSLLNGVIRIATLAGLWGVGWSLADPDRLAQRSKNLRPRQLRATIAV